MKEADVSILLAKLQEEWPILNVVSFSELDIQEKLANQPFQYIRFQEQLIKSKAKLEELLNMKAQWSARQYDKLRFESEKSLTTKEIEQYYLPNDPYMIKLNNAISKQNVIIEYFDTCCRAINQLQWNIKLYMQDRNYGT
jgi:hypothetical protein